MLSLRATDIWEPVARGILLPSTSGLFVNNATLWPFPATMLLDSIWGIDPCAI